VTDRPLLFFGDSLVAGVGDPSGQGWVGRVVAASFGGGLPFTAYNLGVRRETSEQVAARWRSEALPRLSPEADVRIVVSFGANDTTIEHGRLRVVAERSCAALAGILDGAVALGLIPLVIPGSVLPPAGGQRRAPRRTRSRAPWVLPACLRRSCERSTRTDAAPSRR
jgi:acyl-CoA thioesterase-1